MTVSYTTYSEAGGVGKTTTAANLAVAHARAGLDVLVIPLDSQDANLSRLLDVDHNRAKEDIDTLPHHMIERPQGEFDGLIETTEHGVDVVPEHNMLGDLPSWLRTAKKQAQQINEEFDTKAALLNALARNNVRDNYDVIICDPPGSEGTELHNALNATRSLVLPIEPSAKGSASVDGVEDLVDGLQEVLDVEIGCLAAIPIGFNSNMNHHQEIVDDIEYDIPAKIGDRTSLMESCWDEQCSAFTYMKEHRSRQRDHEMETLAKIDRIARFIEQAAGVEAPNPPQPGAIGEEIEV